MAREWILTDTTKGIWQDSFEVTGRDLGLSGPAEKIAVRKRTLQGGVQQGVDLIEVDNGALKLLIVPTRGMGLWRGEYKGIRLGWDSPVRGPVHPSFVNLPERGGLGWLYGFDEWMCRCGLDSNGAPGTDVVLDNNGNPTEVQVTLHGRIANIPAHYVAVSIQTEPPYAIEVEGHVDETMMFGPHLELRSRIRTAPGANYVDIEDRITNCRAVEGELELLYHCNFGTPLLEAGAHLVAPIKEMAPRDARATEGVDHFNTYLAPTPGYIEQVYWYELLADPKTHLTVAMLRNAAGDLGCAIRWDIRRLPYFTQWKNTAGQEDGYVTGLEPGTNLPNTRKFERERGRVIKLSPGQTYTAAIRMEVLDSTQAVRSVETEIERLQSQQAPVLHRAPVAKYSPV